MGIGGIRQAGIVSSGGARTFVAVGDRTIVGGILGAVEGENGAGVDTRFSRAAAIAGYFARLREDTEVAFVSVAEV